MPTPRELSDEIVEFARQRGKPVMIAEAAPQGYDLRDLTSSHHAAVWDGAPGTATRHVSEQQIWDQWFKPMFDYMNQHGDVIQALAYINVRWDEQDLWDAPYESGYWGDTRVEVSPLISGKFSLAIERWRGADQ